MSNNPNKNVNQNNGGEQPQTPGQEQKKERRSIRQWASDTYHGFKAKHPVLAKGLKVGSYLGTAGGAIFLDRKLFGNKKVEVHVHGGEEPAEQPPAEEPAEVTE